MRVLRRRLARVEQRVALGKTCPLCAGRGEPCTVVAIDGAPVREPAGCARCGRVGAVTWVSIVQDRGEPRACAAI